MNNILMRTFALLAYLSVWLLALQTLLAQVPPQPGIITPPGGTICQNSTTGSYTIAPVAGASSYSWSYSGTGVTLNPSGTAVTLTVGPAATGGTLSVVAVNCFGNSIPRTLTVSITAAPPNLTCVSITGPKLVCQGQSVTYALNPAPSGVTNYTWNFGGIFNGMTSPIVTSLPTISGIVGAGFTGFSSVTGVTPCGTTAGTPPGLSVVTLANPPLHPAAPTFTGPTHFTAGQSVLFRVTSAHTNVVAYQWDNNGSGLIITPLNTLGDSVLVTGSASGSIRVRAVGPGAAACAYTPWSSSQLLTVCSNLNIGAISKSTAGACEVNGSAVTFSISSTGATNYIWNTPAGWTGPTLGPGNLSATYTVNGNGIVEVYAVNGSCTGAPAKLQVFSGGVPNTPVYVTPSGITNPADVCPGVISCPTTGSYIFEVTNDPTVTSYTWTLPTGFQIISGQGTHQINVAVLPSVAAGTQNISVVANRGNCGTSSPSIRTVNILQNTLTFSGGILGPVGSPFFCSGFSGSQNFTAPNFSVIPSGTITYTWTFTNLSGTLTMTPPAPVVGSPNATFTGISGNGRGRITVTAANVCGVNTSTTLDITVSPPVLNTPGAPPTTCQTPPICTGSSVTLLAVPDPLASVYEWDFGTGFTGWPSGIQASTVPSITVTAGAVNHTNIRYRVANSCVGSAGGYSPPLSVNVTAATPTTPVLGVPGINTNQTVVCTGTNQTYSVTSTGASTYTWSLPAGWIPVAPPPASWTGLTITTTAATITATAPTTVSSGTISVIASSSCGNSAPLNILVNYVSTPPTLTDTIIGPTVICTGPASASFSVTPVSGVNPTTGYEWTFPAGFTPSGVQSNQSSTIILTNTGATPGTYTISCRAENSCGFGNVLNKTITVINALSTPSWKIPPPTTICANTFPQFVIDSVPGATQYEWEFKPIMVSPGNYVGWDATTATTEAAATVIRNTNVPFISDVRAPAVAGSLVNFNIRVSAKTPGATCAQSPYLNLSPVTITTSIGSLSSITGSTSVCAGSILTYTVTPISGATYTWTLPAGWTGSSNTNSITTTAGTTGGNITVSASGSCGTTPVQSLSVSVNTAVTMSAISGPTNVCVSGTQTYSISPVTGASSYSWSLPAGLSGSSTANSIAVTFPASNGSGIISVTANGTGCSPAPTQTLNVSWSPVGISLSPISGANPVCGGVSQIYSTNFIPGAVYTWTLPSGWTGSSTTNTITVTTGSSGGNLSVAATTPCTTATYITPITVTPNTTPGAISGPAAVCTGGTATYSITPIPTATSYTWTLPGGVSGVSTTNTITANFPASPVGNGTITVTANGTGCATAPSSSLNVSWGGAPVVPTFSGVINTTVCGGTNQIYTVSPVAGALNYTWTLPAGWTGSSTTNSIAVVVGSSSGSIQVRANNGCGSSPVQSQFVTVINPGITSISGPTSLCTAGSAVYSVAAVPGATSYTWNLPTGVTGFSTTNTLTASFPSSSGSGSITVTANGTGCSPAPSNTLNVSWGGTTAPPGPVAGSVNVCSGSSQTYSIAPVPGATSYNWALPTGWSGSSTTTSITATVGPTAGPFVLTVVAVGPCGASVPQALSINVTPGASGSVGPINGPTTISSAGVQTYSVPSVSGATGYLWTLPSGLTGSSSTNTIAVTFPTTPGSGNITVQALFGSGCGSNVATLAVSWGSAPPPTPGVISGAAAVCTGSIQTYSVATVPGATSYNWSLPAGWTGSSTTNSITVTVGSTTGNFSISVTATNSSGTSSPQTLNVTVGAGGGILGAISGDNLICTGASPVSKTYSVVPVAGATGYVWTVPAGWVGSSTSNSITVTVPTGTGNDTLRVYAVFGCGPSNIVGLPIVRSPGISGTPVISGPGVVCVGAGVTYTVSGISGAGSYAWSFPAGWSGPTVTTTNSVTVITSATSGVITVVASGSCGSTSPATFSVSTGAGSPPAQPTAISGDVSVCAGSVVTYSTAPVSGATGYSWSAPSGWTVIGSATSNSITYTAGATSGIISVAAVGSCGAGLAQNLNVTVTGAVPVQPGLISGASEVCLLGTQTYSVAPVPGATSYIWTLPAGWTGSSTTNTITTTTPSGAASGSISVVATNGCGNSLARVLAVNVNTTAPPAPTVINGRDTLCPGSVQIYSVSPVTGAGSYVWTLPTGWTGSSTTNTITVTAGVVSGTIAVAAINNCGSSVAAVKNVLVIPGTPAVAGAIVGSGSICGSGTQSFSIPPVSGATNYIWTATPDTFAVGGGLVIISGNGTNSVLVKGNGSGTLSVQVVNGCGPSAPGTRNIIYATSAPAQPGAILSTTVCADSIVTLAVAPVANASKYLWTVPGGWSLVGNADSATVRVRTTGIGGNVSVIAQNACGNSISRTQFVSVVNPPAAPGTIVGDSVACDTNVRFYSTTAVGATKYQWTADSGIQIVGSDSSGVVAIKVKSTGRIYVNAINSCGRSITISRLIRSDSVPPALSVITASAPVCTTGSQQFSVIANPRTTSYLWNVPAGWSIIRGQGTLSIEANVTGNGTVSVTPINGCGAGGSSFINVFVATTVPPAPGPISGNTTVCPGSTQTYFVPRDSAANYTWTLPTGWSYAPGFTAVNTHLISVVPGGGSGTLQVVVSNRCGNNPVASTLAVNALDRPVRPGNIIGPTQICADATPQTYSVAPVTGALSYTWSLPAGWIATTPTNGNTITVIPGASGVITVTANNGCGASEGVSLAVVNVPAPRTPNVIIGDTMICLGQDAVFSVPADTNVASYNWSVSGGSILGAANTNTIVFQASSAGIATVTVRAVNRCGAGSGDKTIAVQVFSSKPATPLNINGNLIVCKGSTQTYSVNPVANATRYIWTFSSGLVSSSTTNSINIRVDSAGLLSVRAVNACGESDSQTVLITLLAPPTIVDTLLSRCGPGELIFEAANPNFSYAWYDAPVGGILLGNNSIFKVNIVRESVYYVARVLNDCQSERVRVRGVVIEAPPVPNFTLSNSNPTTDTLVRLSVINPGNYFYTWYVNDVQVGSGKEISLFFREPGINQIAVKATILSDTCSTLSRKQTIIVQPGTFITKEKQLGYLRVYPNPTSNVVTVEFNSLPNEPAVIELFDLSGKLVSSNSFQVYEAFSRRTLSLDELPAGSYIMQISQGGDRIRQLIQLIR